MATFSNFTVSLTDLHMQQYNPLSSLLDKTRVSHHRNSQMFDFNTVTTLYCTAVTFLNARQNTPQPLLNTVI